jgi:hypothetical protein
MAKQAAEKLTNVCVTVDLIRIPLSSRTAGRERESTPVLAVGRPTSRKAREGTLFSFLHKTNVNYPTQTSNSAALGRGTLASKMDAKPGHRPGACLEAAYPNRQEV